MEGGTTVNLDARFPDPPLADLTMGDAVKAIRP